MNSPRAWLGLEWVPDGRLIAVGGYDGDRQPTKSVEMLECSWTNETPSRSTWREVTSMLEPRAKHGVGFFAGKLFAAGGERNDTVEYFTLPSADKPNGEWTKVRPLNSQNTLYGLLPFGDGLLCVGKSVVLNHFGPTDCSDIFAIWCVDNKAKRQHEPHSTGMRSHEIHVTYIATHKAFALRVNETLCSEFTRSSV